MLSFIVICVCMCLWGGACVCASVYVGYGCACVHMCVWYMIHASKYSSAHARVCACGVQSQISDISSITLYPTT